MIGFLVTGHGSFASGILSGIKVIAGEQPSLAAVDFADSDSTELLAEKVKAALDGIGTDEVICFCDIAGGSPFRVCATLKNTYQMEVISGASVAMVLGSLFDRERELADLTELAIQAGSQAIQKYELKEFKQSESDDGI